MPLPHPASFEHIAEIESYAAVRAEEKTLALGDTVTFLDFTALADYVAKHRRAARLVAALNGRDDLDNHHQSDVHQGLR